MAQRRRPPAVPVVHQRGASSSQHPESHQSRHHQHPAAAIAPRARNRRRARRGLLASPCAPLRATPVTSPTIRAPRGRSPYPSTCGCSPFDQPLRQRNGRAGPGDRQLSGPVDNSASPRTTPSAAADAAASVPLPDSSSSSAPRPLSSRSQRGQQPASAASPSRCAQPARKRDGPRALVRPRRAATKSGQFASSRPVPPHSDDLLAPGRRAGPRPRRPPVPGWQQAFSTSPARSGNPPT